MPVHQINVNPPDWQPPLSISPSNNTSPAGGESLPEWTPRVILYSSRINNYFKSITKYRTNSISKMPFLETVVFLFNFESSFF